MAKANQTSFKPGQSGNPSGRPPKHRALTELLAAAGEKKVECGGELVQRRKLLAEIIWTAAISGQVKFPGEVRHVDKWVKEPQDKVYDLDAFAWFSLAQWLFNQIDGALQYKINESYSLTEKVENEDPNAGAGDVPAPQIYLPDNGRDKVESPAAETGETTRPEESPADTS